MPAISFLPFLQTIPFATRILTLTLIASSLGTLLLSLISARDAIPGSEIPPGSPTSVVAPKHGLPWLVDASWLVLIPGQSWKFPWVLATSGFIELSMVEVSGILLLLWMSPSSMGPVLDIRSADPCQLVVSAVSLPLASRYLERIWGPRELVRFVLVTIVGSNVIAFGFGWLTYILLRDENYSL